MNSSWRLFLSPQQKLAALATALLWWLAMQQFGLFALGWIAFTPFLLAAGQIQPWRARLLYGWFAGFLCFALHNWWLMPTIARASGVINVPLPVGAVLGVLSVAVIALVHGLGLAALAALWNPRASLFRRAPLLLPLAAALLWFGFEWLRGAGELAHTWGAPAFSQWRNVALLQSTAVLGQEGLSALCIWAGASLALWLRPEYSARVPNLWRVPVALLAAVHFWGAWQIWKFDSLPHRKLQVVLIHTNASSLRKATSDGETQLAQAERATREYFARRSSTARKPDLVVWPETTTTLFKSKRDGVISETTRADRHIRLVRELLHDTQTPMLVGAQAFYEAGPAARAGAGGLALSNQAQLLWPETRRGDEASSSKTRVVPFGERAPFPQLLPFLRRLAPVPPVLPEARANVLQLGALRLGTLICFESCFGSPARDLDEQGAQLLLVLSNDEWFAGTTAPWERAAMSIVRAVEVGLPTAQSTNGGYTLAVDGLGRVLELRPPGQPQALVCELPIPGTT